MIEFLITIGQIVLYGLATAILLIPFYYLSTFLFKKFYDWKPNWILSTFFTSFILIFFVSVLVYVFPFLFLGWKFEGWAFAQTFAQKLKLLGIVFWSLIQASFIYSLLTIVFAMLFSYIFEKLKSIEKISPFLRIFFSLYILSIIIWIVVTIWPWILGGYFLLLFY